MGDKTKIAWCDHTFNPWIGCTKVASGCANCYAEADFDKRRGKAKWGPTGTRLLTSPAYWRQPRKWDREAKSAGVRRRVFCGSLCDVFEDFEGWLLDRRGDVEVKGKTPSEEGYYPASQQLTLDDVRARLFETIDATPHLDWLLLTKRPENIRRMMQAAAEAITGVNWPSLFPWPNVWLGCSASTQEDLDAAMPHLLECRDLSPVLFLSLEPLVGPLDVFADLDRSWGDSATSHVRWLTSCLDYSGWINWVIVGGESGRHARPCDPLWIWDIVLRCRSDGVQCFVKQLGANVETSNANVMEWPEDTRFFGATCSGAAAAAGVCLDDPKGGDPDEWPEEIRVRQFTLTMADRPRKRRTSRRRD